MFTFGHLIGLAAGRAEEGDQSHDHVLVPKPDCLRDRALVRIVMISIFADLRCAWID